MYSRDGGTPNKTSAAPKATPEFPSESTEARLDRIEGALQTLTSSVNEVLKTFSASRPRTDSARQAATTDPLDNNDARPSGSNIYIGPSHSFSFMQESPAPNEAISHAALNPDGERAISEMRNLCSGLTPENTRALRADPFKYDVPSRSAGYSLVASMSIPHPVPSPPPPSLLTSCLA